MPGRDFALKVPQMREAARLYADGWSHYQIAVRFNVSRFAVRNALALVGIPPRSRKAGELAAKCSGFHDWKRTTQPAEWSHHA